MSSNRDMISSQATRLSRESSAAASEYNRKAKEQQQLLDEVQAQKRLLEEQQAILTERVKLMEENLRSFSDRADLEHRQYSAMLERYDQSVAGKQENFRAQLAEEVHFRVGRSLLGCDEKSLRSVEAVAEDDYTTNDLKSFKACLWDSLLGTNGDYLPGFASKVLLYHKNSTINEQAIKAVLDSNICFNVPQPTQGDLANDGAHQSTVQKVEEIGHHQKIAQSEPDCKVIAVSLEPSVKTEQAAVEVEELYHKDEETKQEGSNDRASMKQIDEQFVASPSRHTSPGGFTGLYQDDRTELSVVSRDATPVEAPSIPPPDPSKPSSSSSNKRSVEDDTSEESDTSEPAPPTKKQKTVSKTLTALNKLLQHIETLAKAKRLTEKDFQCSRCGKDMAKCEKPRVAQKCQHFYCSICITDVRKTQCTFGKGNHPEKTKCVRTGCKSIMGCMGIFEKQQVQELKTDYQDNICESDDEQTTDEGETEVVDSDEESGSESE